MSRKTIVLVIVAVLLFASSSLSAGSGEKSVPEILVEWSREAGVQIDSVAVSYWLELASTRQGMKGLAAAEHVFQLIDAQLHNSGRNADGSVFAQGASGPVRVRVTVNHNQMLIWLQQQAGSGEIAGFFDLIPVALEPLQEDKGILSCVVSGRLDSPLKNGEAAVFVDSFLEHRQVETLETRKAANAVTAAAYSPLLGDYLLVAGKKVNLDLALVGGDRFWLATPIIPSGY